MTDPIAMSQPYNSVTQPAQLGQQPEHVGAPMNQRATQQTYVTAEQYREGTSHPTLSAMAAVAAGLIGLGGLLAAIGPFGHWWNAEISAGPRVVEYWVTGLNQLGSNVDVPGKGELGDDIFAGWVTLIFGVVSIAAAVAMFLRKLPRPAALAPAAMGLIIIILAIVDMVRVNDDIDKLKAKAAGTMIHVDGGAGWGLWLALVAGVLMLAGGVVAFLRKQRV